MRRIVIIVMPVLLIMALPCCEKEDKNNGGKISSCQSVIVDISKETKADVLILNKDGSYAIYDSESTYGNGVVQFNTSFDNYFEDGFTIIIGEDNMPQYAKIGDCFVYFSNFFWNTFDCAVIDENGEMSCYWNVPMDCFSDGILPDEYMTKAGMSEDAKIKLWALTKGALFAIAATGAVLAAAPVFAGTATAVGVVSAAVASASLVATGYNEFCKSIYPENYETQYIDTKDADQIGEALEWIDLKNGKFEFKMRSMTSWGLALLTSILEKIEVDLHQSIGQYKEKADDYFLYRDYQIQLESTVVECGPDASSYKVGVETKTKWMVDDSGMDRKWCNVSKGDNNEIIVNVTEYTDSSDDRTCSVTIRSVSGQDDLVAPVKLIIKQSGVRFGFSSYSMEFTQHKGNQAVNVWFNDRVSKWEVTSYPEWCKAQKYTEEALVVIVDDDKKLEATKVGVVTATAYIKGGGMIDRTIKVKRAPVLSWDGTSWHLQPHLSVNVSGDAEYSGSLDSFDISIQDEKAGVFTTTGPWQSMEMDSDGILHFKYKLSKTVTQKTEGGTISITISESASMNLTRVDDNHAYATMSAHASITGDVSGSLDLSGSITGTRKSETKAGASLKMPSFKDSCFCSVILN